MSLNRYIATALALLVPHAAVFGEDAVAHRSAGGGFTIALPGRASESRSGPLETLTWHHAEGSCSVVHAARPKANGTETGSDDDLVLAMARRAVDAMKGKATREPRRLKQLPGVEMEGQFIDKKGQTFRLHVYLTQNRLIQILAQGDERLIASPRIDAIFQSFKLTP